MAFALIESDRKIGSTLFGGSVPSLIIHSAVIGAAVLATLSARQSSASIAPDTTLGVVTAGPAGGTSGAGARQPAARLLDHGASGQLILRVKVL